MAGWLSRATEKLRRPPPPAPDPFSVNCDCGASVSGIRTPAAQRPACPQCGRPVFILPQNVYPGSVKPAHREEVVPSSPKNKSGIRDSAPPVAANKPGRGNSVPASEQKAAATGVLVEARSPLFTPFRLVASAIILIVGLTGWGLWHRSQVVAAQKIVAPAIEAGMAALNAGDFTTGARELKRARDAVDLLRRSDAEAVSVRRACREAIVGDQAASGDPLDILSESISNNGKSHVLNSRHRSTWFLFDTIVLLGEGNRRPSIVDWPIEIEGKKCRIEITTPWVRKAVERAGSTTEGRVIFAAQPDQLIPDPADSSVLVLRLNGTSAFLWSSFDTYAALLYRDNAADLLQLTQETLARQTEQMEAPQ